MATQDKRETPAFVGAAPPDTETRSVVTVPPPAAPAPIAKPSAAPRRIVLLLLAAAAIGGGVWYMWGQPLQVIAIQPWRGAAIEAVYATGIVEAVELARVGTTVAGRIVSLSVDEGAAVTKGQVIAQLDDSQPRARLEDVAARLVQAEQDLARGQDLQGRGIRTVQEVERAKEERDKAAAGVRLVARQIAEHRITSPLDGVVTKRPVEVGETVAANQTMFEVVSDAHMRVAADVDERDIPLVRIGAPVALRSEAFPSEPFAAKVTNIRRAGEVTTRTFRVEADLPVGTKLRIGMTVDVNVVTAERRDSMLVPARAVRNDPPLGGRPGPAFVFRVVDGHAVRTPVETGAVGADVTEIRSGLADGAAIVADPPTGLHDGQKVRAETATPGTVKSP